MSSGVKFVSITTVTSLFLEVTKPFFSAVSTNTSSCSNTTSSPSIVSVALPSAFNVSINALPSTAFNASPIFGTSLPYFLPNVLNCGLNVYVVKPSTSCVNVIFLMFNSSLIIA